MRKPASLLDNPNLYKPSMLGYDEYKHFMNVKYYEIIDRERSLDNILKKDPIDRNAEENLIVINHLLQFQKLRRLGYEIVTELASCCTYTAFTPGTVLL